MHRACRGEQVSQSKGDRCNVKVGIPSFDPAFSYLVDLSEKSVHFSKSISSVPVVLGILHTYCMILIAFGENAQQVFTLSHDKQP